ncbi:MAG: VOC family protein [Candidatus Hydrogenedentes bacterium]|nr:VOC family protein [Candidatus Hydrogenedentota bacterium]
MTIIPSQKIYPCLWFDHQAEDAAKFYTSIFPNSRMGSITRYGEEAPLPAGTVLTVRFQIEGADFLGLNGGPHYTLSPAVSFVIGCDTQEEIDYYWEKLGAGGRYDQCGWLADQFGVSWQVVPVMLVKLLEGGNGRKTGAMMGALMEMVKLDIATLQKAYDEG